MITKAKELYFKHKEIVNYLIFGVLTTAVDFISYYLLTRFLKADENLSNVLSQVIAIIFAFFTNKLFVFEDRRTDLKNMALQFAKFASLRLVTLLLNSGMFFVMMEVLKINDMITKAAVAVIVIILNYVFSKLIVFGKKGKNK